MEKGALDSFTDSSEFLSEREHKRTAADYKNKSGKLVSSSEWRGVTVIEEESSSNHSDSS